SWKVPLVIVLAKPLLGRAIAPPLPVAVLLVKVQSVSVIVPLPLIAPPSTEAALFVKLHVAHVRFASLAGIRTALCLMLSSVILSSVRSRPPWMRKICEGVTWSPLIVLAPLMLTTELMPGREPLVRVIVLVSENVIVSGAEPAGQSPLVVSDWLK